MRRAQVLLLAGLPRRVDLSHWDMPPGDQGFVGSCAAWATIYSLAGWYATRQHLAGAPFAPMAVYHVSGYGADMGSLLVANLMAGMQGLVPQGFYTQGAFDYRSPLTPQERRIARDYRIADWYAVYQPAAFDTHTGTLFPQDDARHAIERSLAQGVPVVLSIRVFTAMQAITAAHPYIDTDVVRSGYEGGHAVFASHYDEHGLWIENEWGLGWGRGGYAELSWDFVNRYVDGALAIGGIAVAAGAPVPAVTAGPARVQVSGVLRAGHEVVLTGRGFRPGAVVTLYRDGVAAGRWPVTPWGTVQLAVYFHRTAPEGPHNYHWSLGQHVLRVQGGDGTDARVLLLVQER
ncbi:MAG: hypothetical protein NVSMB65_17050 [Chloroflexota bacterium]